MPKHPIRRPNEAKRGIIYIRVSTDDQVEGTSLDEQLRQCTAIFETEGLELVRTFRDEGSSAKTADRAVLIEAIDFALVRRNRIDVFMVWKVDRLARNTEDHFAIRRMLRTSGVDLRSATEPIGDDPSSKLFEVMVAGFAEFDNSIRRIRSVNGMRARLRSGIRPFKAPPGYRNRFLRKNGLKKTDPDPIDPLVFPILQRVLKGYAQRIFSQTEMVAELVKADYERLTGTRPNLKLIDRLLSRHLQFYAGWLTDNFGDAAELHRGGHEPMITDEEMHAIRAIRGGAPISDAARARSKSEFPLRGLIHCDACGRRLTASRVRGRSAHYSYYHCYTPGCAARNKALSKAEVERRFLRLMREVTPQPQTLAALTEMVITRRSDRQTATAATAKAHSDKLTTLNARRQKVFEMTEAGVYDAGLARERINALEREFAELALSAPNDQSLEFDPVKTIAEAADVIERISRDWFDLDLDLQQRFQKIVFPNGLAVTRGCRFSNPKPSLLFGLNRSARTCKSPMVHLRRLGWNQLEHELTALVELGATLSALPTSPKSPTSLNS